MEELPTKLTFEQQLNLFKERGVNVQIDDRSINTVKIIGYYKLKEFAFPLSKVVEDNDGNKVRRYDGVTYKQIVDRYYQDKNLRLNILHAIEDIEVALNTQIAYVLGNACGAYGYLSFSNWCNKEKYCKYYLQEHESAFKRKIKRNMNRSNLPDIEERKNLNSHGFPTIWLVTDAFSFGDSVQMLDYMSKKNLGKIASAFDCTIEELISWLKCLNFIRNQCCHNSNIIDIKLRTTPKVPSSFKDYIFKISENRYSDRIAIIIFILIHFMQIINPRYQIGKVKGSLMSIVHGDTKKALQLGFSSTDSLKFIKLNKR